MRGTAGWDALQAHSEPFIIRVSLPPHVGAAVGVRGLAGIGRLSICWGRYAVLKVITMLYLKLLPWGVGNLLPVPDDWLERYQVSRNVNSFHNDAPDIIQPVA